MRGQSRGNWNEQVSGVLPTWVLGFAVGLGGLTAGCAADSEGLFSEGSGGPTSAGGAGGSPGADGGRGGGNDGPSGGTAGGSTAGGSSSGGSSSGGDGSGSSSGGGSGGAPDPSVSAASLLALTEYCSPVGGQFSTDYGADSDIPICGLEGAVFFHADMDIDCDGRRTLECNTRSM